MAKQIDLNGDTLNKDVLIEECIAREVLSHSEVSRFAGGLSGSISNILGGDNSASGIHIQYDDYFVIIGIHIIVYYGINIPQLCFDLQMNIKKVVEELTESVVKEVNITVDGVDRRQ